MTMDSFEVILNELQAADDGECSGSLGVTSVTQVNENYYLCQHCITTLPADCEAKTIQGTCDIHKLERYYKMSYKGYKIWIKKRGYNNHIFLLDPKRQDGIEDGHACFLLPNNTDYWLIIEPNKRERFPFDIQVKSGSKTGTYKHLCPWKECIVDGFTEGYPFEYTSFPKDDQKSKDIIIDITIIRYRRVEPLVLTPQPVQKLYPRPVSLEHLKSYTTRSSQGPVFKDARHEPVYRDGNGSVTISQSKPVMRPVAVSGDTTTVENRQDTFEEFDRFTIKLQLVCSQTDSQRIMRNRKNAIQSILCDNEQIKSLQLENAEAIQNILWANEQIKRLQLENAEAIQKLDPMIRKAVMARLGDPVKSHKIAL